MIGGDSIAVGEWSPFFLLVRFPGSMGWTTLLQILEFESTLSIPGAEIDVVLAIIIINIHPNVLLY